MKKIMLLLALGVMSASYGMSANHLAVVMRAVTPMSNWVEETGIRWSVQSLKGFIGQAQNGIKIFDEKLKKYNAVKDDNERAVEKAWHELLSAVDLLTEIQGKLTTRMGEIAGTISSHSGGANVVEANALFNPCKDAEAILESIKEKKAIGQKVLAQ